MNQVNKGMHLCVSESILKGLLAERLIVSKIWLSFNIIQYVYDLCLFDLGVSLMSTEIYTPS